MQLLFYSVLIFILRQQHIRDWCSLLDKLTALNVGSVRDLVGIHVLSVKLHL